MGDIKNNYMLLDSQAQQLPVPPDTWMRGRTGVPKGKAELWKKGILPFLPPGARESSNRCISMKERPKDREGLTTPLIQLMSSNSDLFSWIAGHVFLTADGLSPLPVSIISNSLSVALIPPYMLLTIQPSSSLFSPSLPSSQFSSSILSFS